MAAPRKPERDDELAVARRPSVKRFPLRFGTWGLDVNFGTRKLELYRAKRPDLAHLTITWKTASRQLDAHLTWGHEAAMAGERPKHHEPLFKVPLDEVERAGVRINEIVEKYVIGHAFARYRKIRPGWLKRRGYIISIVDEDAAFEWIRKVAPRRRWKYRLDLDSALGPENMPPDVVEYIYDAEVLHILASETDPINLADPRFMVIASRIRRGSRSGEQIFLRYTIGPDGRVGWWGMTNREAMRWQRQLLAHLGDLLMPLLQPRHEETILKVCRGLGYDETVEGEQFVADVRRFFRERRNPIRHPYPRDGGRRRTVIAEES